MILAIDFTLNMKGTDLANMMKSVVGVLLDSLDVKDRVSAVNYKFLIYPHYSLWNSG